MVTFDGYFSRPELGKSFRYFSGQGRALRDRLVLAVTVNQVWLLGGTKNVVLGSHSAKPSWWVCCSVHAAARSIVAFFSPLAVPPTGVIRGQPPHRQRLFWRRCVRGTHLFSCFPLSQVDVSPAGLYRSLTGPPSFPRLHPRCPRSPGLCLTPRPAVCRSFSSSSRAAFFSAYPFRPHPPRTLFFRP